MEFAAGHLQATHTIWVMMIVCNDLPMAIARRSPHIGDGLTADGVRFSD
jgi:hypothetical protein